MKTMTDKHLESGEFYERFESGYYFYDTQHGDTIYVTQRMYDKYNLGELPLDDEPIEDYLDGDDSESAKELKEKYDLVIHLTLCACYSKEYNNEDDYSDGIYETPHGLVHETDFIAWWNHLPVELFN